MTSKQVCRHYKISFKYSKFAVTDVDGAPMFSLYE